MVDVRLGSKHASGYLPKKPPARGVLKTSSIKNFKEFPGKHPWYIELSQENARKQPKSLEQNRKITPVTKDTGITLAHFQDKEIRISLGLY